MNPRVLFISRNASLTGAPIVLLHLMRWMKQNTDIEMHLALERGGPLLGDFQALARTTILETRLLRNAQRIGQRQIKSVASAVAFQRFRRAVKPDQFCLVYCNTVACGAVLDALGSHSAPCLAHVHELELAIQQIAGLESFQTVRERCRRFIAVSEAVKRNLVQTHAIPVEQIDVINAFIDAKAATAIVVPQARAALRKELGLDAAAVIIGATGTADWRKGPDLFLQLALAAREQGAGPSVHFVWIGADPASILRLERDARLAGISDQVDILPTRPHAQAAIAGFDLFALTSREDPFPLVMLEAAAVGVPIVCFADAGGSMEFLTPDRGIAVPYLNVPAMATAVRRLIDDPKERERLGASARRQVMAHHTIDATAPRIHEVMRKLIGPTG